MLGKALLSASVSAAPGAYVEDVFSTYLYTGNGSTQTITNGIDLAGEGGLVWTKQRNYTGFHTLFDSARPSGYRYSLATNLSNSESDNGLNVLTPTSTGYSINNGGGYYNGVPDTYASWTFRKAEKFFDVVTYTGNSSSGRSISHNLGSVPGCIIVKAFDGSGYNWAVYHRGLNGGANPQNYLLFLNATMAEVGSSSAWWGGTAPTSTTFSVGSYQNTNQNGNNYVAYLFAHDAGGFGDSGDESVIKCGSYTGNGSTTGPVIDLGWEPQWVMIKRATGGISNWSMFDTMRGITVGGVDAHVYANTAASEEPATALSITSQGFQINGGSTYINGSGDTYIYIAIRRGPMKTPESGTEVFAPTATSNLSAGTKVTTGFPIDLQIYPTGARSDVAAKITLDRLRGVSTTATESGAFLNTTATSAEATTGNRTRFWDSTGFQVPSSMAPGGTFNTIYWNFRRAPGFFDVVCYTCNDQTAPITSNHNLGVVPEMMIVKKRAATGDWPVYHVSQGNTKYTRLNNGAIGFNTGSGYWNNTSPTATQFTVGTDGDVNSGTGGAVAYLFATCPGVSKVGSYTGTGTTQQINCGFTAGARFVLIKRSDSTGDWYVWDTARGIISGNDPYLLLSSTAPEVTSTDYIDPLSSGFEISSTAPAAINASGGTYIFLAIA